MFNDIAIINKELPDYYNLQKRDRKTGRLLKGIIPHNKNCKFETAKTNPNCLKYQFKKGNTPHNTRPLFSERINKDGLCEIKIEISKWIVKQKYIFEQITGISTKGMVLRCKSNDKLNCNPDNWELITKVENAKRNANRTKASETMKKIWKSEKIRVNYGMDKKTKLRVK